MIAGWHWMTILGIVGTFAGLYLFVDDVTSEKEDCHERAAFHAELAREAYARNDTTAGAIHEMLAIEWTQSTGRAFNCGAALGALPGVRE